MVRKEAKSTHSNSTDARSFSSDRCIEEEICEMAHLQPPSVIFLAVAALKAKLTNQPGRRLQYLTAR